MKGKIYLTLAVLALLAAILLICRPEKQEREVIIKVKSERSV